MKLKMQEKVKQDNQKMMNRLKSVKGVVSTVEKAYKDHQ
jgi:DNA-binding FrmR family transcriptional regulator